LNKCKAKQKTKKHNFTEEFFKQARSILKLFALIKNVKLKILVKCWLK